MNGWWVVLIAVVVLVPLSFVGLYFEHRAKWETGTLIFPAEDCPVCRHVIYADRCTCTPAQRARYVHPPHFHGLGYNVSFPCTDERCPESRRSR